MKSALLSWGLLITSLTVSCQKTEKTTEETTSQTAVSQPQADEIVRDTVTGKDGIQLATTFNNTNQTATLVLKGETINLKQDPMGSGIKYSNADYEYSEHQGKMTLRKHGNVIFTGKR